MRDALSESLYTLLDHLNRQWSQPPMNILEVIRNEFLHDLKGDHIAVDARGTPIARAADRAAVERAAPNAAAYFSGADFAETDATRVEATVPAPADNTYTVIEPVIVQPGVPVSVPVGILTPGVVSDVTGIPAAEQPPAPADTIGATDSATSTELTDEERKAILQAPSGMFDPEPTEPYPTYVPADQPPQDNEPGAEQFPEPTVPATDPAKLN